MTDKEIVSNIKDKCDHDFRYYREEPGQLVQDKTGNYSICKKCKKHRIITGFRF